MNKAITTEFDPREGVAVYGDAVKDLGNGKVGGLLVLFTTSEDPDLEDDFFTKETDYDLERSTKSSVYYAHGRDKTIGTRKLGEGSMEIKDAGVWIEAQLNLRDKYEKAIYKLVKQGKLGWSSGTAPHLVERKEVDGANQVMKWPLGLDATLSPIPAEPRIAAVAIKSLAIPDFETMLGAKSVGMSANDKTSALQGALNVKLTEMRRADTACCYCWAWIRDVFDETFVYVLDDGDGDTDYFEAPYSFNGNVATIGDAVQVQPQTQYLPLAVADDDDEPVSAIKDTIFTAPKGLSSLRFGDHSESVRTAVKEFTKRAGDYAALREEKGKDISPERAQEFKGLIPEFEGAIEAMKAALALSTPHDTPEATDSAPAVNVDRLRAESYALDPANWV